MYSVAECQQALLVGSGTRGKRGQKTYRRLSLLVSVENGTWAKVQLDAVVDCALEEGPCFLLLPF